MTVAVATLAVLLLASAFVVPSPAAAACGTNWTSKKEPPPTIRVLRTQTGRVEKVDFKRYVVVVMASGEWPTTMPNALLEAGALATKQYAWYYTLKGNHRPEYRTATSVCYDVRDDSRDQVYRPESAEPTEKQKAARDALWGLSLRKNGRFFLTGYRRGSATTCGADADSWRLYARSAKDCVKRLDYDSERVLRRYYKPNLNWVWAPGTDPEASPAPAADPAASPAPDTDPEASPAPDTEAPDDRLDDEPAADALAESTVDSAIGLLDRISDQLSRLVHGRDDQP
jgi:hypothetical protein